MSHEPVVTKGWRTSSRIAVAASAAIVVAVFGHGLVVRSGESCPVGGGSVSARDLEEQRVRAMHGLAGSKRAPTATGRALGDSMELGKTDRATFVRDAETRGASCASELDGAAVRCTVVDGETLARFDPRGRLVATDDVRYGLSPEEGASTLASRLSNARQAYGDPSKTWGETTSAFLSSPLRQAGFAYRFSDVALDVTVTRLGEGLVLRVQRRSVTSTEGS